MSVDPRDFGAVEARVASLEKIVEQQNVKLDTLIALANQGRGVWWAALTFATAIGSLVTLAVTWLSSR